MVVLAVEMETLQPQSRGQGQDWPTVVSLPFVTEPLFAFGIRIFSSYLRELGVDESADEGGLSDAAVPDEDDVAVVAHLGQPLPDAAHLGGDLLLLS